MTTQGQLIEFADQRTESFQYAEVRHLTADEWIFLGHGALDFALNAGEPSVCARTDQGTMLWNTPINVAFDHSYYPGSRCDVLPDGKILIAGPSDYCESMEFRSAVYLLNNSGTILWERAFWLGTEYIMRAAQGNTGDLAVASLDRVFLLSSSGDSLTSWSTSASPIRGLRWAADSTLLVLADSVLQRYNWNGEEIGSVHLEDLGVSVNLVDSSIVVLTMGSVLVLDRSLELLSTASLSEVPGVPLRLLQENNDLGVITSEAYVNLDQDHAPAGSFGLVLLPGHSVRDADLFEGVLMTAGRTNSLGSHAGVQRSYDLSGSTVVHDEDVGIRTEIDSAWFEPFPAPSTQFTVMVRGKAFVVNNGSGIVEKVLVYYRSPFSVEICYSASRTLILEGLALMPGDSIEVLMPDLQWIQIASLPGNAFTMNVCINALSPNDKVDRAPADNRNCQEITVINTVGIEDQSAKEIKVFPNPFSEHLTVGPFGNAPVVVELFDVQGRLVLRSEQTYAGPHSLSAPGLDAGVYALRASDGTHVWTARVLKSE